VCLLEAQGITKKFGGIVALKDVDLRLDEGEILGLIGPNGSGKTTLFNVICGFYKPENGKVMLDGKDITGLPPNKICRLGIGRTFQIAKPFPKMTVYENTKAAALFSGRVDTNDTESQCMEVLKFTGLDRLKDSMASQLTLANAKRLEVARALATRPKILLLDEVLAGLNPTEIDQGLKLIRSIVEKKIGVLMIEHQMRAIMSACHRIMVLQTGAQIAEGPPHTISKDERVIEAYLGGHRHA
jgi:branched-chain amino acid transport system ATP-binding protein